MNILTAHGRDTQVGQSIPVRHAGRVVGFVVGSEFRRTLQPQHILRYPEPAVAQSPEALDEAERLGAEVLVYTLPDGTEALMGLAAFRELATTIDRGFGLQLSVPLARFPKRVPAAQLRMAL